MDNQQPSPKKGKVQRLSHRGVLEDENSFIVWETPPSSNKIYIYTLTTNKSSEIRYVGITSDPKTRLSHHISHSYNAKNSHKTNWINKSHKDGHNIIMTVIESYDDLKNALLKEEEMIKNIDNLTNIELKPTTPRYTECYVYDLKDGTCEKHTSRQSAANSIGVTASGTNSKRIRNRYLFNYDNDFDKYIQSIATIKIYDGTTVKYAVSHQHAAWMIGCTKSMINSTLCKARKSCKNHNLYHIHENIKEELTGKNYKKVKCINDGKLFASIKKCSEYYSIDSSCISKVCRGKRKHVANLNFCYC